MNSCLRGLLPCGAPQALRNARSFVLAQCRICWLFLREHVHISINAIMSFVSQPSIRRLGRVLRIVAISLWIPLALATDIVDLVLRMLGVPAHLSLLGATLLTHIWVFHFAALWLRSLLTSLGGFVVVVVVGRSAEIGSAESITLYSEWHIRIEDHSITAFMNLGRSMILAGSSIAILLKALCGMFLNVITNLSMRTVIPASVVAVLSVFVT